MKIIFLDFDGVLNSRRYLQQVPAGLALDPACMAQLQNLVMQTGALLVLSTSWREHWSPDSSQCDATGLSIRQIFSDWNLPLLDKTPCLSTGRDSEILEWLSLHPEVTDFVVLDDAPLETERLTGHCVQTSYWKRGLSESETAHAIAILNSEVSKSETT